MGTDHPDIEILLISPATGRKYPPEQRDLIQADCGLGKRRTGQGGIYLEEGYCGRRWWRQERAPGVRSIPERSWCNQLVGRKVWGCSRHCLWLVLMLKRRRSRGSQRAAGGKVNRQGERIRLSKHSVLLCVMI